MENSTLDLGQSESEIRDRIVGTWKLVRTEETMKDGTTRPFPLYGPNARGFLMYQRDGYMSACLVNPERQIRSEPARPAAEERLTSAEGTFFYCGRYEIDATLHQIVHLPELASDPAYIGSRQVRPYAFHDGRLIFSDVERNDPTVVRWKIAWEKIA